MALFFFLFSPHNFVLFEHHFLLIDPKKWQFSTNIDKKKSMILMYYRDYNTRITKMSYVRMVEILVLNIKSIRYKKFCDNW